LVTPGKEVPQAASAAAVAIEASSERRVSRRSDAGMAMTVRLASKHAR
jgi:hypothetical protein